MERSIPHVLDVFGGSPRIYGDDHLSRRFKELSLEQKSSGRRHKELNHLEQKNPGNDSAISVGSSDEEEKTIGKYFDYLNEVDKTSKSRRKKRSGQVKHEEARSNNSNSHRREGKARGDGEVQYIERHLSMKKTIRKKMMRDLQQAFVEDPTEYKLDPQILAPDQRNNINIRNLTLAHSRMSKSEHNFLRMLKDDKDKLTDDDSGNGSPTRISRHRRPLPHEFYTNEHADTKNEQPRNKTSFWKKLTGKGKGKR